MIQTRKDSPIGVDLGPNSVKLVQFRSRGPNRSLLAAAWLNLPFPNNGQTDTERRTFVQSLRKLLSARKFGSRDAVITLPPDDVDVRPLTLPIDERDTADKVRIEAKSYLGYDPADAVLSHVVLGEAKSAGERHLEVLAASVPRSKVIHAIELLSQAGLFVQAVDIAPLALCRVLEASPHESGHPIAAVDIGARSTCAVILDNNLLRMARPIDMGSDALTDAIHKGLEISRDEAEILKRKHGAAPPADTPGQDAPQPSEFTDIARILHDILREPLYRLAGELQKLFRYFAAQNQGRSVERVLLVGGGSSLPNLDRVLASRLATRVELPAPLSQITGRNAELKDGSEGAFAVAAGLALREA